MAVKAVRSGDCNIVLRHEVEPNALFAAHTVQEQVGGDAVQPALEGARLVLRQRVEDTDKNVLHEVFSIVAVAGEVIGKPENPARVLLNNALPGQFWGRCLSGKGGSLMRVSRH